MTTFYICRHGETENNKSGRFSGWFDTPLTENGIRNAESTAEKLQDIHFDRIISSDLGRAFTTAEIVAQKIGFAGTIERVAGLREVNYGDFANQPYEAYPQMTALENAAYVAPNGESLELMHKRVMRCINEIAAAHPDETILLVAHDGTINAVRASFKEESIGIADLTRNPHDGAVRFTYQDRHVLSFESV